MNCYSCLGPESPLCLGFPRSSPSLSCAGPSCAFPGSCHQGVPAGGQLGFVFLCPLRWLPVCVSLWCYGAFTEWGRPPGLYQAQSDFGQPTQLSDSSCNMPRISSLWGCPKGTSSRWALGCAGPAICSMSAGEGLWCGDRRPQGAQMHPELGRCGSRG